MPQPPPDAAQERGRATVLIADDEPAHRAMLRGYLGASHRILEAADGAEALELVEKEGPDLVLLDIVMPHQSGIEVCTRIKEEEGAPYLPVILITSLADQSDRLAALAAGADDFLPKPVDRDQLRLRVGAFLRLRQQEVQLRAQAAELARLQRAKDELVSLILHDVRSPLAGQMALLTLVGEELRGRGDALLATDLELSLRSTRKVNEAIEEVLRVRLLADQALAVERKPVMLSAMVEDAVRTYSGVARAQGSALQITIGGDRVVAVDGKLVRRAIESLLANAIRYSPEGGEVALAVRASEEVLEVEVSDRGPGVPDAFKQTLFAKFGAVEAAAGGARRGIGLGLYLVRLIAEGHGGAVSIEDRPGGGSRFRFWLQLA